MRLTVEVEGEKVLDRAFQGVGRTIERPMRTLAPTVEKWFFAVETEQFFSEGASGASGKWPALSKAYEKQKLASNPFALNILEDSKAMKLSLTRPGAAGQIREVSDDEIRLGTAVTSKRGYPYPKAHQEGRGRNRQRKVIDPSEAQTRDLMRQIQKDVLVPLRRTGLVVTTMSEVF